MSYTSDRAFQSQLYGGSHHPFQNSPRNGSSYQNRQVSYAPSGGVTPQASGPRAISVSQAMRLCKDTLEQLRLTIEGEVSEVSDKPGYKACFFTIKDSFASLPCLMWKDQYRRSGVKLETGMKVQISGRFSAYMAKGRMNFNAYTLEIAGRGKLYAQIKATEEKLRREGLMAVERKRPIPRFPHTVGVVTSPRGAAVHDVLRTLRRRFPMAHIVFAGVPVEGPEAPQNMIQALTVLAQAEPTPDVILLVRGGGSFEDLMPFNDEQLARAVAASPVPVITGIGHEPDNSIADEVADMRQSTPTGAAQAAVPDQEELYQTLDSDFSSMSHAIASTINDMHRFIERVEQRPIFENPHNLFSEYASRLDLAQRALARDFPRNIQHIQEQTRNLGIRLAAALPATTLHVKSHMDQMQTRLASSITYYLRTNRIHLDSYAHDINSMAASAFSKQEGQISMRAARLQDLSPLTILSRGYAITRDTNNHILHSVKGVSAGDKVNVSLHDGTLDCQVLCQSTNTPFDAK